MMDLESVHMAYLTDSKRICFLSGETLSISNNIERILQCALDFRSCLVNGVGDFQSDNQGLIDHISQINISQCPQQLGGRECGYYVMRYMYEILEHHHSSEDLIQDFSRTTPYTEEEINEIRDIWAEYFICNVEL